MSRGEVLKYFEVRLFSLALVAIMIFFLCMFLFFLFIWRGQYVYATAIVALMIIVVYGAIKLFQYAKTFRKIHRSSNESGIERPWKCLVRI